MLLKLVFCLYFLLYFVNGLSTHTRYSDKENITNSMNKQQENHQNVSNAQDVMESKNKHSNKSVGKFNNQILSNKQPNNDINKFDQNLPNIKDLNDKQPNPSAYSEGQHSKQLNKNVGPSSQRLPNSKGPNKKLNNIQSSGQKAHGREETTNRQSNKNQSQGYGQQMPGAKGPADKQSDKNQSQGSDHKMPDANEPTNENYDKNQSQGSGQKTYDANDSTNNQSNNNQIQVSGQKTPGPNEPTNKNQIQVSGQKTLGAYEPTNKLFNKNQIQARGAQKKPDVKAPTRDQEMSGGPKLQHSKIEGIPGDQILPDVMQPGQNEEKPIDLKLHDLKNEGNPGGQKLPDVKEPSKNQGKPGGRKLPDAKQSSKNIGMPGVQKLPDVKLDIKQSSQNEGKSGNQKLTDVNKPGKIEGRPGGQKLPDVKEPSKNQGISGGQRLPGVKDPSKNQDMGPMDDSCTSNKSIHSRNDIIVMINYVYKQLSVDENIREAYQSHAMSLRDKHFKELNKFNTWFHNQPEHLKHVLQSLGSIRKQLIEPNVIKFAKLLNDNSDMDKVIELKKERLRLSTKKLNRYERLCSLNCEEGEERFLVKRNVRDEYFCSSIEDLYNKINTRLSEFVQRFNNESNNRFAKDNDIYHKKINNIKNKLKDKGLQMFGRTMYDILHLQDEYHHYVEHLNISSLEKEINLAKNLSIQVEAKLLELNEQIEKYGQHCQSCAGGSSRRNIREATTKIDGKQVRKNSETLVDLLIDNKFNETAVRVQNDWDAIFKDLNQLITKTEKENPKLGKFKSIQIKVIKMIAKERKELNKLKSATSDMGIQKAIDWVKILSKLLKIIIEIIKHIFKLNSGH